MAAVADLLRPVVDLMADLVRQSRMIHTDATKMPYLDPQAPGRSLSGQMWTYYGDRDHPFNAFDFCADHSARGIDAFLLSTPNSRLPEEALVVKRRILRAQARKQAAAPAA